MKVQNYLFLSLLSFAGYMQCVGSDDIVEKQEEAYCLVAYSERILENSFIQQNEKEKYVDNDIASIIDAYLPKTKLKLFIYQCLIQVNFRIIRSY